MPRTARTLLTDDLLATIHDRAAGHDRDNTFPDDDLADLRAAGYLLAFVPAELGGAGLTLEEVVREQVRLAGAAPATALSINMHLVVTGMAAMLHARGDESMGFVLRDAAAGEVFAFGNSEAGNDLVMFGSRTRAERRPDGGYRFFGTKIFTSLAPVWTRLATFGLDEHHPDGPRLVHGVVTREGTTTKDDWDTLGMRATQSRTTVLDGAYAPADRVVRALPPGPNADPFIVALFSSFEILLAAVYTGIGRRALELGIAATRRRTSMKYDGRAYSQDPDIRWKVADAALAQDGAELEVFALARGIDEHDDYGPRLFAQLVGLKVRATEAARVVVDLALRVSGGAGYGAGQELSRLYRDVLAGIYHPSDDESAHATVAQSLLGPLEP
jgi:alkylation response protein AidB-like acyl-CoA dehydrogenase